MNLLQSNVVQSNTQPDISIIKKDLLTNLKNINTPNSDILHLCISSMQFVEKYKGLTGPQKKDLVLSSVKDLLSNGDEKNNSEYTLSSSPVISTILDSILPSFIDSSISIEKGKISFSVQPEDVLDCCGSILKLFSKSGKQ
jgi:hypothetical protein